MTQAKISTPSVSKPVFILNLAARILPGLALVYAGFTKALAPMGEFAGVIEAYKIIPLSLALKVSAFLPWLEIYTGLFLIFGSYLTWSRRVAAGLFGAFVLLLTVTLIRGIDPASCGCFGEAIPLSPSATLAMDLVFLGLLAFSIWKPSSCLSVDHWVAKGQE